MKTKVHDDEPLSTGDWSAPFSRRRALQLLLGAGAVALVGCGSSDDDAASSTSTSTGSSSTTRSQTTTGSDVNCTTIPEETGGPYPGDGSNGPNVLTQDGVVRSDIRSSFGSASGVAEGVPLTINLAVLDTSNGCAALGGAAVYLWHCDRDGLYSMYSQGITNENYLRGVQETDGSGRATFESIFPAAYSGRWPHIHFQVYSSVDDATGGGTKLATSQLALPDAECELVYATDGYSQSVRNLAQTSLDSDNVFGDGYTTQLATVSGDVDTGFTAELSVPV